MGLKGHPKLENVCEELWLGVGIWVPSYQEVETNIKPSGKEVATSLGEIDTGR